MAGDPYETLGVGRDASAEEIRRAYRSRAREVHPDVSTGADDRFIALSEAYDALSHAHPRRRLSSEPPRFIDDPPAARWTVIVVRW